MDITNPIILNYKIDSLSGERSEQRFIENINLPINGWRGKYMQSYVGHGQSCNEDSSKILEEGRWYWIHDFVATFRVNDRSIYMVFCN